MSEDWSKLAGEKGEDIPTGRLKRALSLGTMGARVAASTVTGKVGSFVLPRTKEKRDELMQAAYIKNAEKVVATLGKLKGASLKVGQMLSADPEMLPPEFANVMSSLQKSAPPMTYETVCKQIEAAYDRPIDSIFSYFDPEPVGAASIGQVHRARLDTGEDVAVKVQYPGVAAALESDLKTLGSLLTYGRAVFEKKRLNEYLHEIRNAILTEADYRVEAQNLRQFQEILKDRPGVRIPRPVDEWVSESVLVMEFMDGQPLEETLVEMEDKTRRDKILFRWVELFSWMFHEVHYMHTDPHPGNFLVDKDDNLILLDFGSVKRFDPDFADRFLDIMVACWQKDDARAVRRYIELGFGRQKATEDSLDSALIRQYNEIVIAPFLKNEPFRFKAWSPAKDGKLFMLRHPSLLTLAPPPDALPYLRVLSGIKGLLSKLDAEINVCQPAMDTAIRRGLLADRIEV